MIKYRWFLPILAILISVAIYYSYKYKLEVTTPEVSFKFVSKNGNSIDIIYSYCYQGEDLLRGSKYGSYGCSGLLTAKSGEVLKVPSKNILSPLPYSKFNYISINGSPCDNVATIVTNEYISRIKDYTPTENEFNLDNYKGEVLEIPCTQ
jgi:hypothetical protein